AAKSVLNCKPDQIDISASIRAAVQRAYKKDSNEVVLNPYGEGNTSGQVIDMIKTLRFEPSKAFFDLDFDNV
ncbi:UDP-N-acetylglucosamine 2-epimerase (hydrolyzing), partial [Vibrio parahaemolyticus]